MERIVVGVDGSDASRRALEWAVREAACHGGRVEAVLAWHIPYPTLYPYGAIARDETEVYEKDAHETLDRVIESTATGGLAEPIEKVVVWGHPAGTLCDVAKGADLLVVGSRGLGGFTGLLLGSVGTYCVHHASCPVLVVRSDDD